jgi:predicted XRE-type DNA-binding protein
MIDNEKIEFVESSGNIFADLGLPNPEERLAKAELAREIRRIITDRDLTQAQAGAILGIAQPNVSDLMPGKLARFSVEKMLEFLTALGRDIKIVVTASVTPEEPGEITVAIRSAMGRLRSVTGGTDGTLTAEPMAATSRETRHRRRATPPRRSCIAMQ